MGGQKCDNCGKGIMIGHNVSHAKNRTRKVFKPNLHSARIWIGGSYKRMRLCTKCLRVLKAQNTKLKNTAEKIRTEEPLVSPVATV